MFCCLYFVLKTETETSSGPALFTSYKVVLNYWTLSCFFKVLLFFSPYRVSRSLLLPNRPSLETPPTSITTRSTLAWSLRFSNSLWKSSPYTLHVRPHWDHRVSSSTLAVPRRFFCFSSAGRTVPVHSFCFITATTTLVIYRSATAGSTACRWTAT